MTADRSPDFLASLVQELCKLPVETGWLEFKLNNSAPDEIGESLSALANSAALDGKAFAYVIWGIEDDTHQIVGTQFRPAQFKIGNEELESWLLRLLNPKIGFRFLEVPINNLSVVLLEINRAARHPVQFKGQEFIRIGSYTKKLKDFPEKERALWRIFEATPFEDLVAAERIEGDNVLKLLDYSEYGADVPAIGGA